MACLGYPPALRCPVEVGGQYTIYISWSSRKHLTLTSTNTNFLSPVNTRHFWFIVPCFTKLFFSMLCLNYFDLFFCILLLSCSIYSSSTLTIVFIPCSLCHFFYSLYLSKRSALYLYVSPILNVITICQHPYGGGEPLSSTIPIKTYVFFINVRRSRQFNKDLVLFSGVKPETPVMSRDYISHG